MRTVIAAACLILGSTLLIPTSLWLWRFLVSRLTTHTMQYLPDAQTEFILSLNDRAIDSVMAVTTAAVVGTLLLLVGLGMLR